MSMARSKVVTIALMQPSLASRLRPHSIPAIGVREYLDRELGRRRRRVRVAVAASPTATIRFRSPDPSGQARIPIQRTAMAQIPVDNEMLALFKSELALCKVRPGETVSVISAGNEKPDYAQSFMLAAIELGATAFQVNVPRAQTRAAGVQGRHPLAGNQPAIEALKQSDLLIDLMGLLFSKEQAGDPGLGHARAARHRAAACPSSRCSQPRTCASRGEGAERLLVGREGCTSPRRPERMCATRSRSIP